jgi:hypothetical protein
MMFFADDDIQLYLQPIKIQTISGTDILTNYPGASTSTLVLINPSNNQYVYGLNSALPAGLQLIPGIAPRLSIDKQTFFTTVPAPPFEEGVWSAYLIYDPLQTLNPDPAGNTQVTQWQWGGDVANALQRTSRWLLNRIEPDSLVTPTALNVYDDAGTTVIESRTIANASGAVNPEQILRLGTLS